MRIRFGIVWGVILLFGSAVAGPGADNGFALRKIRSIGDDQDPDQFFMKITAGVISPEHEIFVGDTGGKFIAKYSWQGNLIKRIGQAGQGPGDFLSISRFGFFKSNLITYDIKNCRICMLTPGLDILNYIKIPSPLISGDLIPVGSDRFVCSFRGLRSTKGAGRIGFIDAEGKLGNCFFPQDQFGNSSTTRDELQWALNMMVNRVFLGYDEESDIILAGFEYPAIPAKFFLFNSSGKRLGTFNLETEKDLIFPEYKRNFPRKIPSPPVKYLVVRSILKHQNDFLVLTSVRKTGKNIDEDTSSTCYLISSRGMVRAQIEMELGARFFNITEDGYLIGKNDLDEIPQVHIWKLTQKATDEK